MFIYCLIVYSIFETSEAVLLLTSGHFSTLVLLPVVVWSTMNVGVKAQATLMIEVNSSLFQLAIK